MFKNTKTYNVLVITGNLIKYSTPKLKPNHSKYYTYNILYQMECSEKSHEER